MNHRMNRALSILLTLFFALSCSSLSFGQKGSSHETLAVRIAFTTIPGGSFQMGDETGNLWKGCLPVHTVKVSEFDMSIYEITNEQYAAYLNAALTSGDIEVKKGKVYGKTGEWAQEPYLNIAYTYGVPNNDCWISFSEGMFAVTLGKEYWPVVAVSWFGAKSLAGYYGYDLPTEAEWEYAARGGRQYKYGTDDGTIHRGNVNYNANVGQPSIVGTYPPNPFGLYDMSGNVWEWCNDWYGSYPGESVTNPQGEQSGTVRIIRQGAWDNSDWKCRVAYRGRFEPENGDYGLGIRLVRRP